MARGGVRPNSGRKKGSKPTLGRQVAEKAMALDITPIEVLLFGMRYFFKKKQYEKACLFAKDAAPYCHPKLNSVEFKPSGVDTRPPTLVLNFVTPSQLPNGPG